MNERWLQPAVLLLGDWLALTLFVFIGQLDHGMVGANPLPRLVATTVGLALPWTVVAALTGAYRPSSLFHWRTYFGRAAAAWFIAAPLALAARSLLRGQAAIVVIFLLVTLGLGGAFLLGWRLLYWWVWRRQTRPRHAPGGGSGGPL